MSSIRLKDEEEIDSDTFLLFMTGCIVGGAKHTPF
jgi:hypothetical protein